jgi:hypothetical protein
MCRDLGVLCIYLWECSQREEMLEIGVPTLSVEWVKGLHWHHHYSNFLFHHLLPPQPEVSSSLGATTVMDVPVVLEKAVFHLLHLIVPPALIVITTLSAFSFQASCPPCRRASLLHSYNSFSTSTSMCISKDPTDQCLCSLRLWLPLLLKLSRCLAVCLFEQILITVLQNIPSYNRGMTQHQTHLLREKRKTECANLCL